MAAHKQKARLPLKSSAIPFLSSYILNIVFATVPTWLLHIFNSSIDQGIFPDSWKKVSLFTKELPKIMLAI